MLRAALALALALVAATAATAAPRDWRRLRIGTDGAYPPFSLVDADGRPDGFDVDVAKAVCARLAAECEIVALGWEDLVPALLAKRVDLTIASQPTTEEARRRVEFTAPYHRIPPRFVGRIGDATTAVTAATARGRRIGVRDGTVHAAWAKTVLGTAGATIVGFPTEVEAGAALAEGRVDLVFGDTLTLYRWLDRTTAERCCGFVGAEVNDPRVFGSGAAAAFRREDRDLGALVDKALTELGRDGSLDRLAGHWIPFAIR